MIVNTFIYHGSFLVEQIPEHEESNPKTLDYESLILVTEPFSRYEYWFLTFFILFKRIKITIIVLFQLIISI